MLLLVKEEEINVVKLIAKGRIMPFLQVELFFV